MKLPVFRDPVTREPSFSITVAAVTFTVVLAKWLVGGVTLGTHKFTPVTTDEITTWLTPTLLLYFGRQATKATEGVAMKKAERAP